MNAAAALSDAVWLEIRKDERQWRFVLDPAEERAIVVGSHPTADVSFAGPKVAPLHVHFERVGKEVWIVPAYGASLRVNDAAVRGPCKIPERATVELGRVRLDVHSGVLEAPRSSYPPPSSAVLEDVVTAVIKLPSVTDSIVPTGSVELSESSPSDGPITDERSFDDAGRTLGESQPVPISPTLAMTISYDDSSVGAQAASPIDANATVAFSLGPPPPEPAWETSGIPESETPSPSTGRALAVNVDSSADAGTSPPKMTQRPAEASVQRRTTHWLERLGHFGKSRPLLAVVSAVGAALVLVLALFGVRALVEAKGEKAALATKSPAASSLAALPTDAAPTASPSKPAPLASEGESPSEADAPDAVSPPASAQSNRAAEDASAKEVDASGTKTSADVTAAVNHLRAGRYVEARAAYLELAAQEPTNDAYAAAARMLSLRIGSQCSGANVSARCPEIKP